MKLTVGNTLAGVDAKLVCPSLQSYLVFLGHSQCGMAICSCCHIMMCPGSSENHKRGYCVNGARQVKMKGKDDIPNWPQPQGIYVKGTDFPPIAHRIPEDTIGHVRKCCCR